MSWSSRRLFLLSAAALAGCGFTPAYGPGGGGQRLRGAVLVDEPDSRPAYLLTRRFEERLGRSDPARARYRLSYAITLQDRAIAISSTNVTTRYNKLGTVRWALRDAQTDQELLSGEAESFNSYSASGTPVATEAAERDAEARLMTILTDQIVTRLTAEAGRLPS